MKANRIIGLTGGIASGKTAVSECLKSLGAVIVDADEIARTVTNEKSVSVRLQKYFPEAFVGGRLDRKRLREVVFGDEQKLKILNSVTHPAILKKITALLSASDGPLTVLCAPLLFEAGLNKLTEYNVCVCSNADLRLGRLIKRDGVGRELAVKMMDSQLPDGERKAKSDFVIENDGTLEELYRKTRALYERLVQ